MRAGVGRDVDAAALTRAGVGSSGRRRIDGQGLDRDSGRPSRCPLRDQIPVDGTEEEAENQ